MNYSQIKTKYQYIQYYKKKSTAREYSDRDETKGTLLTTASEISALEKYAPQKRASYLDLATGGGRIIKHLHTKYKRSIGVDTSSAMLTVAKNRVPQALFLLADISKLPFSKNSFDFISGFRFMINLPQDTRMQILFELKRVIKKGGIIALNFHLNKHGIRGIRDILLRKRSINKLLSIQQAQLDFKTAGLTIIQTHSSNISLLYKVAFFLPSPFLLVIDSVISNLPFLQDFGDTFIIFAKK